MDAAATAGDALTPRGSAPDGLDVDVCIVGGGLTGLWTAHSLIRAEPTMRVAVLEAEVAGYGASGRNGGWCSALFPVPTATLAADSGLEAALAQRRAMIDTVAEVGRVAAAEGIDCDFARGGTVVFARTPVEERRADAEAAEAAHYGVDPLSRVSADDVAARWGVTGVAGHRPSALVDPNCASVQPAKLVRGLARVVEDAGVALYERTRAVDWAPGRVRFRTADGDTGMVRAERIVIALEGYGPTTPRVRRRILPLYSLMIATEPLSESVWDEIGLAHGETFSDERHLLVYGQRTADDRFAFGGRGAGYRWGSRVHPSFDRDPAVFEHLHGALGDLFPAARGARVTHRWGGPLGVARDWHASVSFNPATGVAFAGGYVGDGLSTTNLAGRTLADLLRGVASPLTSLPWVNHRSPLWEPEPLRWLGANAAVAGLRIADAEERVTGRRSAAREVVRAVTGH
ncbi:FAD-dependent oxidoreductase [Agromyces sp. MMS17-SY077]|uniref:FAD-dependent oxidoreductase n=1 Tax=Agromyces seonyuensis TaxID=2662446 RepID=A0A6I4NYD5_9MICO|nr:FAD-dependent oxidoreductase [Agromyces seonyuensis]